MNRLPFENLRDSMQFQQLCAELLQAEGCKNVRGLGKGADQGNDFMFDLPVESPLGSELKPFLAQCKWYNVKNSISENEVSDSTSYIDTHNASGILIITSSQFTGTAITKIEAISRSPRNSYQISYWNGTDLTKRLRKHPDIINKFFYSTENQKPNEQLPEYDETKLLSEFGLNYFEKNFTIDTFPEIPGNELFIQSLRQFAGTYLTNPPKVIILDGVLGAGKTGYGCALLNIKAKQGLKVAYVPVRNYKDKFFQYYFNENNAFLPFLQFCQQVDILFLDDIGLDFTDKSPSLIQAAESCINLIEERAEKGKLTISSITDNENRGKTVNKYVEHLKTKGALFRVGDKSLRQSYPSNNIVENNEKVFLNEPDTSNAGFFLGKDWLIEKYELIEKHIDFIKKILLTPVERDYALRKRLFEEYGSDENREDEILGELDMAKLRLDEYKKYISRLNFNALFIQDDGKIEIIEKH